MKYCVKCGTKITGNFCANCGYKVEQEVTNQITPEMAEYLNRQMYGKKCHNGYRISTGIIMIVVGAILLFTALYLESLKSDPYKYYRSANIYRSIISNVNIIATFVIPSLLCIAGGILSVISKKQNTLLLISGILYLVAALCNMVAISDISILFILACTFGVINIVFYSQVRN